MHCTQAGLRLVSWLALLEMCLKCDAHLCKVEALAEMAASKKALEVRAWLCVQMGSRVKCSCSRSLRAWHAQAVAGVRHGDGVARVLAALWLL